jgi:hypothetical protein
MSSSSEKPPVKICAQRLMNGDPCPSPALRDERFCHYHKLMGPPPINIDNNEDGCSSHIYLPPLEDAASIQSAISEVCELMLHRRIEPKEATALFYAMQVASTNMAFLNANKNPSLNSETTPAPSSDRKLLPPGTIQACEQPRRRKRHPRA